MRPISLVLLLPLSALTALHAHDGDLDAAFHGDGRLVLASASASRSARAIATAPDGKLVVGFVEPSGVEVHRIAFGENSSQPICHVELEGRMVASVNEVLFDADGGLLVGGHLVYQIEQVAGFLARFLYPDCELDPDFGSGGWAELDPSGERRSLSWRFTLQPNGRIVGAGIQLEPEGGGSVVVARLLAAGTLDPSLDGDGYALRTTSSKQNPTAIAVAGNGDLLVTGYGPPAGGSFADFFVWQLESDGRERNHQHIAFDLNGAAGDQAHDAALLTDGRLAIVGRADTTGTLSGLPPPEHADGFNPANVAVAVLKANGAGLFQLDPSFVGGEGRLDFGFGDGTESVATGIAGQCDGKMVIVGYTGLPDREMAAIRLLPSGARDTDFGAAFGIRLIPFDLVAGGDDLAHEVTLDAGRAALVGAVAPASLPAPAIGVARLTSDFIFADKFEIGSARFWGKTVP